MTPSVAKISGALKFLAFFLIICICLLLISVSFLFLQKERLKCQMDYMESVKQLEEKLVLNQQQRDLDVFTHSTCIGQVLPFETLCRLWYCILERGIWNDCFVIGCFSRR